MIRWAFPVGAMCGGCALGMPPATAVVPQQLPPGSVKHQNSQYGSWAGPRNWLSADGAYGIQISSGNGRLNLDHGFSSIVCAAGNTVQESVANYYAQQRAQLRQSLRANWRKVRLALLEDPAVAASLLRAHVLPAVVSGQRSRTRQELGR